MQPRDAGTVSLAEAAPPAGAVICGTCGSETPGPPETGCAACGAPLVVLEPLVVRCGWCGRANHRHETAHCLSCGGPLPALPGGNPGPRPPATPRQLPQAFVRRVRFFGNTMVLIGVFFTVVFFWTVLFALIGIPLAWFGNRKALDQLHALREGRPTRGTISAIYRDRSQQINNQHPWKIDWAYERHDGTTATASAIFWDDVNARRQPGDVVWVVYGEREGRQTAAIWPPLK